MHDIPSGHDGRGRGSKAVADMKARLAAMSSQGMSMDDQINTLWERHHAAVTGNGHEYGMAEV